MLFHARGRDVEGATGGKCLTPAFRALKRNDIVATGPLSTVPGDGPAVVNMLLRPDRLRIDGNAAVFPLQTNIARFADRLDRIALAGHLSLLLVCRRELQQIAGTDFPLAAAKQLHVAGDEFLQGIQSNLPLLIAYRDRTAVAVNGQHVLVTIAAFNHHPGFPGIGFIELMTGVGDFIEHRHRNGLLPQFSPGSQHSMNAGIYRTTVGVQLDDNEGTGPRLRRPVRPVSHDVVNRRLRFLNGTPRERG